MEKKKRSFFKVIILTLVRYIRWKSNPKNYETYYWMKFNTPKNVF